jgi:hypothetical protein
VAPEVDMPLRVLAAGGSKEEKDRVEALVRTALAARAAEAWFISLVKLGNKWSVTLDGPGVRSVTLMSTEARLAVEITAALGGTTPAAGPEPQPAAPTAPAPKPAPTPPPAVAPPSPPPPSAATPPSRSPTVLRRPTGAAARPAPVPPAPSPAPRPTAAASSAPPAALPKASAPRPTSAARTPAAPASNRPVPSRPAPTPPAPAPTPASANTFAGGRGERRETQSCTQCGDAFVVVYVAEDPDEGLETVAVACPHCWHINQAMLPASVAYNNEYRAEKP